MSKRKPETEKQEVDPPLLKRARADKRETTDDNDDEDDSDEGDALVIIDHPLNRNDRERDTDKGPDEGPDERPDMCVFPTESDDDDANSDRENQKLPIHHPRRMTADAEKLNAWRKAPYMNLSDSQQWWQACWNQLRDAPSFHYRGAGMVQHGFGMRSCGDFHSKLLREIEAKYPECLAKPCVEGIVIDESPLLPQIMTVISFIEIYGQDMDLFRASSRSIYHECIACTIVSQSPASDYLETLLIDCLQNKVGTVHDEHFLEHLLRSIKISYGLRRGSKKVQMLMELHPFTLVRSDLSQPFRIPLLVYILREADNNATFANCQEWMQKWAKYHEQYQFLEEIIPVRDVALLCAQYANSKMDYSTFALPMPKTSKDLGRERDRYTMTYDTHFEMRLLLNQQSHIEKWNKLITSPMTTFAQRAICLWRWGVESWMYEGRRDPDPLSLFGHYWNFDKEWQPSAIAVYDLLSATRPKYQEINGSSKTLNLFIVNTMTEQFDDPRNAMVFVVFYPHATDPQHSYSRDDKMTLLHHLSHLSTIPTSVIREWIRRFPIEFRQMSVLHAYQILFTPYHKVYTWSHLEQLLFVLEHHHTSQQEWHANAHYNYWINRFYDFMREIFLNDYYVKVFPCIGVRAEPWFRAGNCLINTIMKKTTNVDNKSIDYKLADRAEVITTLRQVLQPTLLPILYDAQTKAETKARTLDPFILKALREFVPRKDSDDSKRPSIPKPIGQTPRRTLVVSFETAISYMIEYPNMDMYGYPETSTDKLAAFQIEQMCHYADALFVDGNTSGIFTFQREIPQVATLLNASVQPNNTTTAKPNPSDTKHDENNDYQNIARMSDQIEMRVSKPRFCPYYVRPGMRQMLQQCVAIGYDLILFSDRSEHKVNTAIHAIDPDQTLFPLDNRIYWGNKSSSPEICFQRPSESLIVLGNLHHTFTPKLSFIPVPGLRHELANIKEILFPNTALVDVSNDAKTKEEKAKESPFFQDNKINDYKRIVKEYMDNYKRQEEHLCQTLFRQYLEPLSHVGRGKSYKFQTRLKRMLIKEEEKAAVNATATASASTNVLITTNAVSASASASASSSY